MHAQPLNDALKQFFLELWQIPCRTPTYFSNGLQFGYSLIAASAKPQSNKVRTPNSSVA